MNKKLRLKIFLGIVLVFILLGIAGGVIFYAQQSRKNVAVMTDAISAFENGDYDTAVSLFTQVLKNDPNNEMATLKLAQIYERRGRWPLTAYYYGPCCMLNGLNKEYVERYTHALLKGRFFSRLKSFFANGVKNELLDEEQLLNIYATLMSGATREGIDLWSKINEKNVRIQELPFGNLIKLTYFSRNSTIGEVLDQLDTLTNSDNDVIAQEAIIARASLASRMRDFKTQEAILKKLTELNYYIGSPMLGEFYANRFRYLEAIAVFEEYLKQYDSERITVVNAELLVITQQADKLKDISAKWRQKRDKKALIISYYIDALHAFATSDFKTLSETFKPVKGQVQTPMAWLVAMAGDISVNDAKALEQDCYSFLKLPPFLDFQQRAKTMLLLYIDDRVSAGDDIQKLFGLAELLRGVEEVKGNTLASRIDLLGKLQKGTLLESEIKELVMEAANDQTVLEVAINFYYFKENYERAWDMAQKLEALENVEISNNMRELIIRILELLDKPDLMSERFVSLIKIFPSENNVMNYWIFATTNNRVADLKNIIAFANNNEFAKKYIPVAEVAIQIIEGDKAKALDALAALEITDDALLNFAGYQLAVNDRFEAAISKYSKISSSFAGRNNVILNMIRAYRNLGAKDEALKLAASAYSEFMGNIQIRIVYALCAKDMGDWKKALELAAVSVWHESAGDDLKNVWIWAMEEKIKSDFASGQFRLVKTSCGQVQVYDSKNAVAKEYLEKAEEELNKKD